jgi:hypothetical protein
MIVEPRRGNDVESVLTMKECICAVEAAFRGLARDRSFVPQRTVS